MTTELKTLDYLFSVEVSHFLKQDIDFYKKHEEFDDALFSLSYQLKGYNKEMCEKYIEKSIPIVFKTQPSLRIAQSLWKSYLKTEKNNNKYISKK